MSIRKLIVSDQQHGQTLEQIVSTGLSVRKSFARLKVLNGEVTVCGTTSAHGRKLNSIPALKPATRLNAGDQLSVVLPLQQSLRSQSYLTSKYVKQQQEQTAATTTKNSNSNSNSFNNPHFSLVHNIIHKDQHILVINKPNNLPVQQGSKVSTCVASMLHDLQFSSPEPPRLVHRLDKGTTGCLILARTKDAAMRLSKLFATEDSDILTKRYQAVTLGAPIDKNGSITTGIVHTGTAPTEKLSVIEWHETDNQPESATSSKKAVTVYNTVESQKHVSLVDLAPTTGRKHQLRLHCAQILKTPILGDYKYGEGCPKQLRSAFGNIQTVPIHLHLREISIKDWFGIGKPLVVKAPLPPHFDRTLKVFNLQSKVDLT